LTYLMHPVTFPFKALFEEESILVPSWPSVTVTELPDRFRSNCVWWASKFVRPFSFCVGLAHCNDHFTCCRTFVVNTVNINDALSRKALLSASFRGLKS
jgi:hypothetical protein